MATERVYRRLQTDKDVKSLMTSYYRKSKILPFIPFFKPKIAWVTSGAPVELLVAMDILPLYPENYGAIVGAAKMGVPLCQVAEAHGWSQDLCSYARSSLGSMLEPKISPMRGLRKPDVLICGNNICGTVLKWYEAVAHYYNAPLFVFDTPPIRGDGLEEHQKKYVMNQVEELIAFLEKNTGKKYNEERLQEAGQLANEAVALWKKILFACKTKPSPLNCADRFVAMAPVVTRRGTREAVDFYQKLLTEVQDRVTQGIGAIREEKIRLLWDNIPIWFSLYSTFNTLAAQGVVFPADSYTNAWASAGQFGGDPIEAIAERYSDIYLNKTLNHKIDLMSELIKEFHLDGFILHSDRSCKRYSLGQPISKKIITQRTGVPGVIIEADMVDSRAFSEEQVKTRIEGLLEMIG
ncbi:MAG: 2-hydroxyacyl-CoA dehydratase subunit D [Candidatus Heimdallarchaeota archaeon]